MKAGENLEIEIKLPLHGPVQGALERLGRLGFGVIVPRVWERNVVYDTPGRTLRDSRQLIRIRRTGSVGVLTYKGPGNTGKHKSREEIELGVSDPNQLELVFERLGYQPVFQYEKFRTEYGRAGEAGVVTVDETPVGNYFEIEGSPEWIDHVAEELGFSAEDYVTESYGTLYASYCAAHGIKPSDMLFQDQTTSLCRTIG